MARTERSRRSYDAGNEIRYEQLKSNNFRHVEDGIKAIEGRMDRMDGRLRDRGGRGRMFGGPWPVLAVGCNGATTPRCYGMEAQSMKSWRKLAALLLAVACTGDATAPDPARVEPELPAPPANRAPEAAGEIPAQRLPGPGEAVAVAVGAYFADPDGDTLTFAAASADTAVVSVAVEGDTLRLAGGSAGGAGTVTVTAADPSGLSASASVSVSVNRAPEAAGDGIPAQRLVADYASEEVDASAYFTDPDGDALAFAASSSDTAVVRVAVTGTALTLDARAVGAAVVTVTASDPDGLEARAVFTVEVTENPERAALAALYEATGGPNWTNNENWLTDAPLGAWHGVTVGADGRVESLDLSGSSTARFPGNFLRGPIPPELGNLASLEVLDLGGNGLDGPIPPELGDLARLEHLDLNSNGLTSSIPPELGDLASLEVLDLGWNGLTGSIPPELGNLARLRRLDLGENDLTGPIPAELEYLRHLKVLILSNNDLTGPIPRWMAFRGLSLLSLKGNPRLCAPEGPRFRELLIYKRVFAYPCRSNPDARLLSLALMRADGNGMSLELPDDLHGSAVIVSDPGVVAAAIADGRLELTPRSIGRADVELAPSGGGSPAIATVAVREAVGTFGIDIVMDLPSPLTFEETMVAAADWWSYMLDGTEWEDRRLEHGGAAALADELLIHAGTSGDMHDGYAGYAQPHVSPSGKSYGGKVVLAQDFAGMEWVARHEIGHILGLVLRSVTGLRTEDGRYFTGPRAVEAYRAGGGDPDEPGILLDPSCRCHWYVAGDRELMSPANRGWADGLSLAALVDFGHYTVDMTKATPWRLGGAAAAAMAGEPFREVVEVRVVPGPVPE